MKISLCMIAKDEIENLKRLKPLVEDHIDEWIVVFPPNDPAIKWAENNNVKAIVKDFTVPVEDDIKEKMQEYGVEVKGDYRLFKFAEARNESFKHATGDYILWLDADDEPVGLENFKEFAKDRDYDVYEAVYDYARDEQGNPISDHVRERIIKNNGNYKWYGGELGLIHETLLPKNPSQTAIQVPRSVFNVKHVPEEGHDDKSSLRNHVALLYEYIKTKGKDPRTIQYLSIEFFNRKAYPQAIQFAQEHIKKTGSEEHKYQSWIRCAESYHQLEDKESSRNAYLNATKILPQYPDAWLGLGESYFSSEMWDKAAEFIKTGLQKPVPQTKGATDMTKYTFRPLVFLALASRDGGRPDKGYEFFLQAKKMNPNHPWVKEHEQSFVNAKNLDDYVRSFVKVGQIAKKFYPETLPHLAEAVPEALMGQEILLDFKRRFSTPKKWAEDSIVYFCSQAFEEWGPDSLKTGTGGSEEAVIHLTKRWAEAGYDVTVFNNCPEEKTDENGVHWKRFERFNPNDEFNILIGWRNNPFLDEKKAKKKLIDVHDVPSLRYFPEDSLKDVTLMVKSEFHRSLFPDLKDDNFTIINNGIEVDKFKDPKIVKNKLVYTSSYDRGLEYLLEMWSDIKKEVPDATLDVAYGWNLFDQSAYGRTDEGKKWKKKMEDLLKQDGVTHHGRLNSEEVNKLYLEADVIAYPTDFPEIDMISLTKAMAGGAVPITTDYAAMKERNQGVMIKGDIKDTYKKFRQELISLLKDENKKEEIRKKLDVSKFDWDTVAKKWIEEFKK